MSALYGVLTNERGGRSTRCAHRTIEATAASWLGCIKTTIQRPGNGPETFETWMLPWHGQGATTLLASGTVGSLEGLACAEPMPPESDAVRELRERSVVACDRIALLLDGKEWTSDTLEQVAALIRATGRDVREPVETR